MERHASYAFLSLLSSLLANPKPRLLPRSHSQSEILNHRGSLLPFKSGLTREVSFFFIIFFLPPPFFSLSASTFHFSAFLLYRFSTSQRSGRKMEEQQFRHIGMLFSSILRISELGSPGPLPQPDNAIREYIFESPSSIACCLHPQVCCLMAAAWLLHIQPSHPHSRLEERGRTKSFL